MLTGGIDWDDGKSYRGETVSGAGAERGGSAAAPSIATREALFQIAIVLGSVSIVAASRPLVNLSGVLAIAGTLLMINGYFLLVHLPFE